MSATVHSTILIEKSYPKPPDRVFAAFADPARKRRWFAEGEGFEVDGFEMEFRVGGLETSRFRFKPGTPVPAGTACANDSWYCDIVENQRIVVAYTMTVGGARISASLATFEFRQDGDGTRLVFTEQAAFFEGGDGPEMREQGWRQLLERLAVEISN